MLAVKLLRDSCFTKKLLGKPLEIRRKLWGKGRHESGSFFIPNSIYLHNPLSYLWTQFQFTRIRLLWDREFKRSEFYRGARQAATVMTKCIREQDQLSIDQLTTSIGYQQITSDMILSRNDARLQLVRFRFEDFHHAVPTRVVLFKRGINKNCFIDVLFAGLRNTKDFQSPDECELIERTIDQLECRKMIRRQNEATRHRILFAEIHMRFFRNYSPRAPAEWLVSFYKIISFDVLNYG